MVTEVAKEVDTMKWPRLVGNLEKTVVSLKSFLRKPLAFHFTELLFTALKSLNAQREFST